MTQSAVSWGGGADLNGVGSNPHRPCRISMQHIQTLTRLKAARRRLPAVPRRLNFPPPRFPSIMFYGRDSWPGPQSALLDRN